MIYSDFQGTKLSALGMGVQIFADISECESHAVGNV